MSIAKTMKLMNKKFKSQTGVSTMTAVNVGGSVWSGVSTFNTQRHQGAGMGEAVTKGVVDAALIDIIGFKKYLLGAIAINAPKAVVNTADNLSNRARQFNMSSQGSAFSGSTFVDSEQAYTMRQAGMQQVAQSAENTKRAVLGAEARHMHR